MIDIHTHLLPGVDDGVKSKEETIILLENYKKNGFEHVFLTPHVNEPFVKTDIEHIKKTFDSLKKEFDNTGVKTYLASELYLKPNPKGYIPILDRFILIELPVDTYPHYVLDEIFELQLEGYDIILAHVERYVWLYKNQKMQEKLKEMNVYFQLNISSVNMKEGKYYLENDYIDFLASDNHGSSRKDINLKEFKNYKNLMDNSKKILGL